MKKSGTTRRVIAVAFLAAALFAAAPAQVAEANVLKSSVDVLLVRPLRIIKTGMGIGLGLPLALIALPAGVDSAKLILNEFIVDPAESIYKPRLGDFDY